MTKFDVWVQPWIPVEKTDGAYTTLSISDTLGEAHNIAAIRAPTPGESFGIARLLITILTDIYRPEYLEDIDEKIRAQGFFDKEKLSRYYADCLAEGASFDLFDNERPFLQYAFSEKEKRIAGKENKEEKKDKENEKNNENNDKADAKKPGLKLAATLFDHLPAGNNVPHFNHNHENSYAFTPERCAQALCAIPFYEKTKRSRATTSGINDVPPIYFLYNGDTLFETLTASMVAKAQYPENPFGLPLWRDFGYFNNYKSITTPSLLHGLLCAPVKLQLKPNDDGLIRNIYVVDQGIDYKNVIWRDPHVAYSDSSRKEGNPTYSSLKGKAGRAIWRDLPIIISPAALKILSDWNNRALSKNLLAFVKITEFKTIYINISQFTEEVKIPTPLLDDDIWREYYSNVIKLSDGISQQCSEALKINAKGKKKDNPYAEILPSIFLQAFFARVKEPIESGLVDLLLKTDTDTADWRTPLDEYIVKNFRHAVSQALDDSLKTISDDNVDTMILKNIIRNEAKKKLNYLLKKGGYTDGGKGSK